MRLDLFLKKTMIVKRRVIAKQLVESGKVFINGKVAKPSSIVKNLDEISIKINDRIRNFQAIITIKNNKELPTFIEKNYD